MQRREEDERSRAGSRRSSATPRRGARAAATPRRPAEPELLVLGKQMRRTERANSLPFSRRQSVDCLLSGRSEPRAPSREELQDDLSLDFSQVFDFEDTLPRLPKKPPLKTSTPKSFQRPRRSSLQISPRPCQSRESRQTDSRLSGGQSSGSRHSDSQYFESQRSEGRSSEDGHYESRQNDRHSERHSEGRQSLSLSRVDSSFDSGRTSRDSLVQSFSNASTFQSSARRSSEADRSVSPEYSTPSSADDSPRRRSVLSYGAPPVTDRCETPLEPAQASESPSCYMGWSDLENSGPKPDLKKAEGGEWNHFWANYNNSISRVPMKTYYDQCPTPYRSEHFDITDLDFDDTIRKSPTHIDHINQIIQKDGLFLTPRETQSFIKCAHILGNVLSKAIDRKARDIIDEDGKVTQNVEELSPCDHKTKEVSKIDRNIPYIPADTDGAEKEQTENMEKEQKRKNLRLELREQNQPVVAEVKTCEAKTTQTDISLPNTKSAPKIFEKILRQLSKSSIDVPMPKEEQQKPDGNSK